MDLKNYFTGMVVHYIVGALSVLLVAHGINGADQTQILNGTTAIVTGGVGALITVGVHLFQHAKALNATPPAAGT